MSIILSAQTQELIEKKLKTGAYSSADEVVHAALEALDELTEVDLDEADLDAIDRAEDQIERGEVKEWSEVREQFLAKFKSKQD